VHDPEGSNTAKTNVLFETRKRGRANVFTGDRDTDFIIVSWVACANVLVNALRRDSAILWQARVPRVMWEVAIGTVALRATSPRASPALYLLLAAMTATTAVVDIFVWAPIFAYFADFRTCEGGWFSRAPRACRVDYTKGLGRLFVSAQSLSTGVFYLYTAITALGALVAVRDDQIIKRDAAALSQTINREGGSFEKVRWF